ncbi:MAG: limonene-1,2-epoxide hydrolase family protein [Pseudomonadota bacterium]|nr:limonene-1,2-epoxide hydrolase family protein [Pseudomonadota bacterium]
MTDNPMHPNERTVRDFIAEFEHSWPASFDRALSFLAEDASYQMVVPTIAPVTGKAAIRAALDAMRTKVADQKHDMLAVACAGDVVFTERMDYSLRKDHWVPIPLVAVFRINADGKISDWKEYLDLYHNMRQHGLSLEDMERTLGS